LEAYVDLKELSKVVLNHPAAGQHMFKSLDKVPLKVLDLMIDRLDGEIKQQVKEYLNHPTIAQELENEIR